MTDHRPGVAPIFLSEHRYQLALRRAGRHWTAAFAGALRAGALRWPSRPEDPEEE